VTIKTLGDYMAAAQLPAIPPWAGSVVLKFPPFKHQVEDLNFLAGRVRSALWHEMGAGKTYPIQALMLWYVSQGNRCVAIMPPVLVQQFKKSLESTFVGVEQHVRIEVLEGDVKARNQILAGWAKRPPDVAIMSYNMFKGRSPKQKKGDTPAELFNEQALLKLGFTFLFCDEAHGIKHPKSNLHKAVKKFVGNDGPDSNGVCLATGSPVANSPEDAYGLMAVLNPKRYSSARSFERVHVVLAYGLPFRKVLGYRNLDYLHEGLLSVGRRVTKKQVMKDLPPKLYSEIEVRLKADHMALYRKLVKEQILFLPNDFVIDATNAASLRQKVAQIIANPERYDTRPFDDNALFEALDELIEQLAGRKVLVYAWYNVTIEKLLARYKKLNPVALYGGVAGAKREQNRLKFINDSSCRLLVSQPASGGVGVDGLQSVCSHVVWAEMTAIPGLFSQANDRLHRGGQTEPVNVYLLTVAGTVSVHQRNELMRKSDDAERVVQDKEGLLSQLLGEEEISEWQT
jgi:SNF2 family DNA or RNA helicase